MKIDTKSVRTITLPKSAHDGTTYTIKDLQAMNPEKDASLLIARMIERFPGLADCETGVDGGNLVEWIAMELHEKPHLKILVVNELVVR